jgi:predicted nucleic acid-binding protein
MILDTAFLISLREEEEGAKRLAAEIEAAGLPTRIPTIVIWEIYFSVGAGSRPIENKRDYEQLFANKPTADLTEGIARRAGVLMGTHRATDSKRDLDPGDSIVAATGLAFDEAVVTDDGDFEDVDGLNVEGY